MKKINPNNTLTNVVVICGEVGCCYEINSLEKILNRMNLKTKFYDWLETGDKDHRVYVKGHGAIPIKLVHEFINMHADEPFEEEVESVKFLKRYKAVFTK